MYYLRELVAEDRVPHLPAFLDSLKGTPQHVFITHGEEEGAKCLA